MDAELSRIRDLKIRYSGSVETCAEATIYRRCLPLAGVRVLDLGCGAAVQSRAIAGLDDRNQVVAYDVDEVQHKMNVATTHPPNVAFKLGGAVAIAEDDLSFDVVLMFKSLHHVPQGSLTVAFQEIHRVLKPGGLAYFSEPVFAGEFNDILRLFHDEEVVRQAAFNAICAGANGELFTSVDQIFFNAPIKFDSFADFENKIIQATHSEHHLAAAVYDEVKSRMESRIGEDGIRFSAPMRVNLLRKS